MIIYECFVVVLLISQNMSSCILRNRLLLFIFYLLLIQTQHILHDYLISLIQNDVHFHSTNSMSRTKCWYHSHLFAALSFSCKRTTVLLSLVNSLQLVLFWQAFYSACLFICLVLSYFMQKMFHIKNLSAAQGKIKIHFLFFISFFLRALHGLTLAHIRDHLQPYVTSKVSKVLWSELFCFFFCFFSSLQAINWRECASEVVVPELLSFLPLVLRCVDSVDTFKKHHLDPSG